MTETTPYDADRARFTRQALARLVLCDHAVDVADSARGLVATENDPDTGPGVGSAKRSSSSNSLNAHWPRP